MQILLTQSNNTSMENCLGVTQVTFKRMHRRFDYYNSLEREKMGELFEQIKNSQFETNIEYLAFID